MKEPLVTQDRHEHIQREVTSLSPRFVEQQVFVYLSDATSIWSQVTHGILRLYWWRGQERIPPIPLELLVCDHVVGVHPASTTSNLKKGVNTYIWMKLNTNDGNKIKLWILLFTYFILFFRVASLRGRVVDELAHIVSTEIIPLFLPQALYKK